MTLALESCQSRVDRTVRHVDEAEFVDSRHQLVSIRVALGKEPEQDQPENSLQELGVVLMRNAGVHNCMVRVIVKYCHGKSSGRARLSWRRP